MTLKSLQILFCLLCCLASPSFAATTRSEDPEKLTVTVILSEKEVETTELGKPQYVWLTDADDGFSGKCTDFNKEKRLATFKVDNKTFWSDANVKKRKAKVAVFKK